MNINKDILAFYWLRFVMWFYFIFRGMTTKSSKEIIIYHVILPVDIDWLKKLKWRPINPVSIEMWNSIQLLHFIEYIQQYFSYVMAVSYIGGGSNWQTLSHIVVDPTTCTIPSLPRHPLTWMCIKHLNIIQVWSIHTIILGNCTCTGDIHYYTGSFDIIKTRLYILWRPRIISVLY